MSDILSFVDDLLESIAQVESSNSNSRNDFKNINLSSTSSLLDECLSTTSQDCSSATNTNTSTLRQVNQSKKDIQSDDDIDVTIKSQETVVLHPTYSKQHQQQHTLSLQIKDKEAKEDLYLNVAQRKIERDKLSQLHDKQKKVITKHNVTLDNLETQSKEVGEHPIDVSSNNRDQHQIINRECDNHHDEIEEEDVNRLAYKCLDMFMKEVKEFCNKDCEESIEAHHEYVKSFTNVLEDKYLKLSLNLLPEGNETVSKVKTLITRFIAKCRKKDISIEIVRGLTALFDPKKTPSSYHKRVNTWQCVLCLKKDISVEDQKCVNCGRHRGFRKKEYDTQKITSTRIEEKKFLAESDYTQKVKDLEQVVTVDEQKRRHYLYGKCDFEIESRLQLKSDVSELLESIRDFTV